MRRLDISRAHVVGHSTGGLIALLALAAAPEKFGRAVLLDTVTDKGIQFRPESLDAFVRMSRVRAACQAAIAATIEGVDQNDPFFQKLVDGACDVAPAIWTELPRALMRTDASRVVAAVKHPTLVLHGDLDPILPVREARAFAARLKNGTFVGMSGRGHSPNVEAPELFAQLVSHHLYETDARDVAPRLYA